MKISLIFHTFVLFLIKFCSSSYSKSDCEYEIYHKCQRETIFTDEEVENVRLYLQKRFAKTRPVREPCKRLHVRKDIKCLTDKEFQDFVAVIKEMHRSGFMDKMTAIHHNSWTSVHKYGVGHPWHRWFIMLFEKEMMRINPKVTLPYWDYFTEFAEPHKSKIWDLFGHSGTADNDYCVTDGPFANMTFQVPTPHCYRRQFNPDGTIKPWEGPEWATAYHQRSIDYLFLIKGSKLLANWTTLESIPRTLKAMKIDLKRLDPLSRAWSQYALSNAFVAHFKTHLAIGGPNGDMSKTFATNDALFYVFHCMISDLSQYQWQLMDDRNLVPQNYDLGVKYDFKLKRTAIADLNRDTLPVFTDVLVKETFQLGYGEICYVHDQLIKPINELIRGYRRPVPKTVNRLRKALPKKLFELYYPKFALYPNKVNFFDHLMIDVPDHCNAVCKESPVAYNFVDTPEGRELWHEVKNGLGMDLSNAVKELEDSYLRFMAFIKHYNYCSPYVS